MDANLFTRNQNALSFEQLAPYLEQHVAWSEDGKEVLAHAPDLAALHAEIERKQITRYVIGFVPDPAISDLGGAFFDF